MSRLYCCLSVVFLLSLCIRGQDPCEDLKKEFEDLQKKIEENIQKIDKLIQELENQENPDDDPGNPDEPGNPGDEPGNPGEEPGNPGEEPGGGGEEPGEGASGDGSKNPVNGSLTDEEWSNLTARIHKELADAVENIKKWLGPGGIKFWDCIDREARLVLTELMLYVGPREFKKQFDKMKGVNYKKAAEIIRNSRWGRQNRERAEKLAKRLEEIEGPVNPPDKRQEVMSDGLEECWPEEAVAIKRPPWWARFQTYFKNRRFQ